MTGLLIYFSNQEQCPLELLKSKLLTIQETNCQNCVVSKPKLRFYKQFKQNVSTENYVKINLTRQERSIIAQTRFGILPINIEVGRFRGVPLLDRLCPICRSETEDELHFVFKCPFYDNSRHMHLNCTQNITENLTDKFTIMCETYPRRLA